MKMEYNYPKLILERCKELKHIEGQVLEAVLINVVEPEYNVLYLKFTNGWFQVSGEIGSEFISISKIDEDPIIGATSNSSWVGEYEPYNIFINKKVISARHIGEAWNGHGFEISFENMPNQTLLVQSIYTGTEPKDFGDCIRLGIGQYSYEAKKI